MATIAILGGAGQVARHLHPLLLAAGHMPRALVRRPEQAEELEVLGARSALIDLEAADAEALAAALEGVDAVIFAAGGGPDGNIERKRTVDLGASLLAQQVATDLGIDRFVQISAIGVDDPIPADTTDVWRAYVEAKRDADAALRETALAWTILRPGRLTDVEPTGGVELGPTVGRGDVTRADVAAMLAMIVDDGRSIHQQWNLIGGATPIPEAVTAATTPA